MPAASSQYYTRTAQILHWVMAIIFIAAWAIGFYSGKFLSYDVDGSFKGDVIKRQGTGATASFTVRKISDGVGVERLFPVFSPNIDSIQVNKVGRVRRAKLYFQRERSGKSARIKEKRMAVAKNA